jgi:alginate O-acetyltransferase complex protein AlgI
MRPVGLVLTFLAVSFSMVFFRSTTLHGAMRIIHGMFGLDGIALPGTMLARLGSMGRLLQLHGVRVAPADLFPFDDMVGWLLALSVIVFTCPNTQQILARYEPALGITATAADRVGMLRWAAWRPSLAWGLVVAVVAALAVLQLSGPSEFLYWQF